MTSVALDFFINLLLITNPIAGLTCFLSLTKRKNEMYKRIIIKQMLFSISLIMLASFFIGKEVLDIINVSINSLELVGGALILFMGYAMVQGRSPISEQYLSKNIAIIPLSIPLLTGPGTMSLIISYSSQCQNWPERMLLIAVIIVVAVLIAVIFSITRKIQFTDYFIKVITSIIGLLLMSRAAQMIITSVQQIKW